MRALAWILIVLATLAVDGGGLSSRRCSLQAGEPASGRREQLARELAEHDHRYFVEGAPVISDSEYDALRREWEELAQAEGVSESDSSEDELGVGDDRPAGEVGVAHLSPMLGLRKAFTEAELASFLQRTHRTLAPQTVQYLVEPKLDGVALNLVYESGRFVRAATRGNGAVGQDVTAIVATLPGVPRQLRESSGWVWPQQLEVRAEYCVRWEEFGRVNAERERVGDAPFAHPRSLAAGRLQSDSTSEGAGRIGEVVVHGIGAVFAEDQAGPDTQAAWYTCLRAGGFRVVDHVLCDESELTSAIEHWPEARRSYAFPLDGVVVKVDALALQRKLGHSRAAPRWAIARKFESEQVQTRLRAVTWQVGRTGQVVPVAELEPVYVSSSRIQRASLHQAGEVMRRDLHEEDVVSLQKAGEIIPLIVGVDLTQRRPGAKPIQPPELCPSCHHPLAWRSNGQVLQCENRTCPARLEGRLLHLARAEALGLRGLTPRVARRLVELELVRDLPDLFALTAADLQSVMPERAAAELAGSLASARTAPVARVLAGLGLSGVTGSVAERLGEAFSTLEALQSASVAQLEQALGSAARASRIYRAIQDPDTAREMDALARVGGSTQSSAPGVSVSGYK